MREREAAIAADREEHVDAERAEVREHSFRLVAAPAGVDGDAELLARGDSTMGSARLPAVSRAPRTLARGGVVARG